LIEHIRRGGRAPAFVLIEQISRWDARHGQRVVSDWNYEHILAEFQIRTRS
jgi:hypothetical protein